MATCHFTNQLDAFRDGELDAVRRDAFQQHLEDCDTCKADLSALAGLSQLFVEFPQPDLSQIGMYRLHKAVDNVMEEKLVRLAKVFSAVAACILAVSSIWLWNAGPGVVPSVPYKGGTDVIVTGQAGVTVPPWLQIKSLDLADPQTEVLPSPLVPYYGIDSTPQVDDQSLSN